MIRDMAETQNKELHAPSDLGTAPIGRLLLQPAIISSLATSLYNIIDSIFIGPGS